MMVAKPQPPGSGRAILGQVRDLQLFRRALGLDAVHVTVFVVRALTFRAQTDAEARSARADAIVAAAGLTLAVVARRRGARAPVAVGLLLNTAGCIATFMLHARDDPRSRRAPWWTTYLLVGGDALSLVYLAAGGHRSSRR